MSRNTWKDYFSFSKKERIAVAILTACIVVSIALVYFFSPQFKAPFVNQELQQQLTALQVAPDNQPQQVDDNSAEKNFANTSPAGESTGLHPFGFDPNTLDEAGFKQMGLGATAIQSILSYRKKGGHFNAPEDFKKMEGLSKADADELVDFIRIKAIEPTATKTENKADNIAPPAQTSSAIKKIDINTATAEDFKNLPGIGDVLANRIIKFRNAVDGFKSVEDIRKTYGLPDSVYHLILPYLTIKDPVQTEN